MTKCSLFLLVVALSLCLLADPAWSATVGKITGRVTDVGGKPLPGVNVTVQGTRLGTTSDAEGYYLILSIEPGIYELKVSIIGYETVREKNVQVFADRTTEKNFTLKETAVAGAEMVVQAERPLVEVDRTGSEAKISEKDISQIPILRGTVDYLSYVAGVDPVNREGNGVRIRRHHGYLTQFWQTWTLDGMELTNLDSGYQGLLRQYNNLPVTSIGEMAVVKGGPDASQPGAASGVVNVVTREGTRSIRGGIDYRIELPGQRHRGPSVYDATVGQRGGTNGIWRDNMKWNDPDWVNETDPITGKQIHVKQDYTGAVGHFMEGWLSGPLSENVTFIASGKFSRAKQTFPAPHRLGLPQWSVFGKLTFTPTSNLKLKLGYNQSNEPRWDATFVEARGPNTNVFMIRGRNGFEQQWRNRIISLTATHTISPKTYHEFQVGFFGTNIDTTGDTDPTTTTFRRDKRGYFNLDRQNRQLEVSYNRRYNLRYDFTSQIARWSLFKVGFTHQIFNDWSEWITNASQSSGSIFIIAEDSQPGKRFLAQRFAGYVENKLEFQGFVMNAGLRYDALWGGSKKTLGSWYKSMVAYRTYKAYLTRTPRAHTKPMTSWAPRIGVSHPITARSAVRFDFGSYYKPAVFGQMWAEAWNGLDLKNHPTLDYTWADEPGSPGSPGGGWRLDSGLHNPSGITNTTEFEVSGSWNFVSDFVLDMATYYRRTENVNVGASRTFYDPVQPAKGSFGQFGQAARVEAKGIETSLYKPLSHNFSFRFSVDVGWSFYYIGGPRNVSFYPDSTYIAGPNYFLVDKDDNPVRLTEAQIRDIGARANLAIRNLRASLAKQEEINGRTTMIAPFSQYPNLSGSERNMPEIQGLWYTIFWEMANKAVLIPSPPTTQASFQFLWSTPPDWGPGPKVGRSKLLGGIQANLVWRFTNGEGLKYIPPGLTNETIRRGPMFVRTDLNFQKTFEMRRVSPTVYAEVFNLFDSFVDQTLTTNYIRWGLKLPTPNDGNYLKYGEPSPFRGGTPRYVNVGVRFGF